MYQGGTDSVAFIVAGEKYGRKPGRYVVIGRVNGRRQWRTVRDHEQARLLAAQWTEKEIKQPRGGPGAAYPLDTTLADYSQVWLSRKQVTVKARTMEIYRVTLRRVLLPRFGAVELRHIQAAHVRDWLGGVNTTGQ